MLSYIKEDENLSKQKFWGLICDEWEKSCLKQLMIYRSKGIFKKVLLFVKLLKMIFFLY